MTRVKLPLGLAALLAMTAFSAPAFGDDEIVVRLPGSGEIKSDEDRQKLSADRLKPGGGLLASFDTNEDGMISDDEVVTGIERAFLAADANGDGVLTAIEQQKWAAGLPTHDDTLSNPVRFDPNLDRRVSFREFSSVITDLGVDYRGDGQAELRVASLKAPKDDRRERETDYLSGDLQSRSGTSTDF